MAAPGSYVELTESWGMPMPHVEQEMIYRRYQYLSDLAAGRRLLEIGCGTGLGNHMLAGSTAELFSFDLEYENISNGRRHAPGLFGCSDAQQLPFSSGSLDVVAACEMIYYVPNHDRMLAEIRRVVRPGGAVFLAMANPERPGFHHSPFSTHYPSARDAAELLRKHGFEPELYGVFPLENNPRARLLRFLAGIATRFHLVPRTLAGRGFLKKIFFGELTPYRGIDEFAARDAEIPQPVRLEPISRCTGYSVLYAVGRLTG
jgi:SAM-dependent methyltransferase